jgi:hypothetical protein
VLLCVAELTLKQSSGGFECLSSGIQSTELGAILNGTLPPLKTKLSVVGEQLGLMKCSALHHATLGLLMVRIDSVSNPGSADTASVYHPYSKIRRISGYPSDFADIRGCRS